MRCGLKKEGRLNLLWAWELGIEVGYLVLWLSQKIVLGLSKSKQYYLGRALIQIFLKLIKFAWFFCYSYSHLRQVLFKFLLHGLLFLWFLLRYRILSILIDRTYSILLLLIQVWQLINDRSRNTIVYWWYVVDVIM